MNETFKALSDPTRRRILQLLRDRDMSAGEIAEHFQISKPSISHHLNALKHAGLVDDERKGQHIVYSINTTVVQEMMSWFIGIMQGPAESAGNVEGLGEVQGAASVEAEAEAQKELAPKPSDPSMGYGKEQAGTKEKRRAKKSKSE